MKRRHTWCVVSVAVLALGSSAMPVFAADTGTVNAQIVVGGTACLTVSSGVDFGTAQFQAPGSNGVIVGTPSVAVTSCSSASETILARGTDATAPGVQWTLATAAPCPIAQPTTNQYNLGLRIAGGGGDTYLPTTNTSLGSVSAGGALTRTPIMRMPCTGSTGQGQTMSMSYLFTAIP